jgi:hypothetical protein
LPKLNRFQRAVTIGAAIVIALIQLVSLWDNGVDENRGWVWALVVAAGLLVVGFAGISDSPAGRALAKHQPQAMRKPTTGDLQDFAGHVGRSIGLINANSLAAEKILQFAISEERYHREGPIAFAFDPQIHSALAAHGIFLLAIRSIPDGAETIVWETYRSTLANRLADKRYKLLANGGAVKPADKNAESEIHQILVDQIKGEIKMWEDVVPLGEDENAGDIIPMARLASAVFGGLAAESDYQLFLPLFRTLLADAVSSMPILAGKSVRAT